MAYCKFYQKIACVTFSTSIICEYYMYINSNKKTYKNTPVQLSKLHFNILNKSMWKGLLWPWHVPLAIYNCKKKINIYLFI